MCTSAVLFFPRKKYQILTIITFRGSSSGIGVEPQKLLLLSGMLCMSNWLHNQTYAQRSQYTKISMDICRLIYSHNPAPFQITKIFFTLLQTLTIPILGKYITGHKNVSHNALYVYTKVTMGRGSACRKVRIAVPGSIPGTNNFLLQLLLSFLFRLKDSPWMSLFFYLFVSLSIFAFLCNLLSKH